MPPLALVSRLSTKTYFHHHPNKKNWTELLCACTHTHTLLGGDALAEAKDDDGGGHARCSDDDDDYRIVAVCVCAIGNDVGCESASAIA